MNLKYMMQAAFDAGVTQHPQAMMREIGIKYARGIPQSIGDQWWFIGCTCLQESLPSFLAPMADQSPDVAA